MKTQRAADIVLGCLFALLGIFVIYSSMLITGGGPHRLSPQTFPRIVGILLLLCGAGLALKARSIRGTDLPVAWPDRQGSWTILVTLVSLVIYIAVMDWLGLPLASFLYLFFSIVYLKPSKWLLALVISVITAVISYYLFINLLGLSFPTGSLFE
ncbi:MAG: tripartite tricarboxylate transporter TctB family protein [Syntrophales bacterium]